MYWPNLTTNKKLKNKLLYAMFTEENKEIKKIDKTLTSFKDIQIMWGKHTEFCR